MRRVLFSDLHGNDAALASLLEQETGTILSAGDVLGRSGSNQRCLELMKARGVHSVQGNHELRMLRGYSPTLQEWAVEWIRSWPLELVDERALITHTLFENYDFFDIDLAEQAEKLLIRRPLVFTGHKHRPGFWKQPAGEGATWTPVREPVILSLEPDTGYLIQIGSLGEPAKKFLPRYLSWTDTAIEWHR